VQRSFHEDWLSSTFSQSTFGSGVVAIGAGILANFLAAHFGTVAPFDASLVLLVGGAAIILTRWRENYGEAHGAAGGAGGGNVSAFDSFRKAARLLVSNERVLLLGLIQSCFEGAMYIFVFMWTPALEASLKAAALYDSDATSLPHGVVFALFMVAIMIGSKIFETLIADRPVEHFMRWVFVAASAALAAPILTSNHYVQLAAFCTFEVCCGIYFPSAVRTRGSSCCKCDRPVWTSCPSGFSWSSPYLTAVYMPVPPRFPVPSSLSVFPSPSPLRRARCVASTCLRRCAPR